MTVNTSRRSRQRCPRSTCRRGTRCRRWCPRRNSPRSQPATCPCPRTSPPSSLWLSWHTENRWNYRYYLHYNWQLNSWKCGRSKNNCRIHIVHLELWTALSGTVSLHHKSQCNGACHSRSWAQWSFIEHKYKHSTAPGIKHHCAEAQCRKIVVVFKNAFVEIPFLLY